jgi:hypothetical protein
MKHPNEDELIAFHDARMAAEGGVGEVADDVAGRAVIAEHVKECPECKAELDRIDAVLAAFDSMPVPEPGDDYGQRVWRQIAPRLPAKLARWWEFSGRREVMFGWLAPRQWAAVSAIAALVIAAFLAGRLTKGPASPVVADAANVRERVLVMAVGEHLGKSEMVLIELTNAMPGATSGVGGAKAKQVDISAEQRRAENLLEENRLYRQTALEQGDAGLASVLDELERVLLDVAHSPKEVSAAQLETMQERIAAKGILFKVRVVGQELQQREQSVTAMPGENGAKPANRKI